MTDQERERLFVSLFTENRQRVLRLCSSYLHSADEAEDLFQEIMVNVWRSLPAFRGEAKLTTWLYRIAVNTALVHRNRRERTRAVLRQADGPDLPDVEATSLCSGLDEERLDRLHDAIRSLPPRDRLLVTLLLEDNSYKEIAEITGMTVNHVGVRIARLKRALEARLKGADDGL